MGRFFWQDRVGVCSVLEVAVAPDLCVKHWRGSLLWGLAALWTKTHSVLFWDWLLFFLCTYLSLDSCLLVEKNLACALPQEAEQKVAYGWWKLRSAWAGSTRSRTGSRRGRKTMARAKFPVGQREQGGTVHGIGPSASHWGPEGCTRLEDPEAVLPLVRGGGSESQGFQPSPVLKGWLAAPLSFRELWE